MGWTMLHEEIFGGESAVQNDVHHVTNESQEPSLGNLRIVSRKDEEFKDGTAFDVQVIDVQNQWHDLASFAFLSDATRFLDYARLEYSLLKS